MSLHCYTAHVIGKDSKYWIESPQVVITMQALMKLKKEGKQKYVLNIATDIKTVYYYYIYVILYFEVVLRKVIGYYMLRIV